MAAGSADRSTATGSDPRSSPRPPPAPPQLLTVTSALRLFVVGLVAPVDDAALPRLVAVDRQVPALDGGLDRRVDRAVLGQLLEDEHPAFRQLSIGPEGVEHGVDGLVAAFGVDERRPAVDHPADLGDDERVRRSCASAALGGRACSRRSGRPPRRRRRGSRRRTSGAGRPARGSSVRTAGSVRRPGRRGPSRRPRRRAQRTNMDYSAVHDVAALPCPHPTVRASRG